MHCWKCDAEQLHVGARIVLTRGGLAGKLYDLYERVHGGWNVAIVVPLTEAREERLGGTWKGPLFGKTLLPPLITEVPPAPRPEVGRMSDDDLRRYGATPVLAEMT
jgi:hypothetical protein